MRALVITEHGPPEVLRVQERPDPRPAPARSASGCALPAKSVIGLNMLTLWDSKESLDEYVEPLSGWLEQGHIRPVVAQRFPLAEGPAAHCYLHERRNVGKVVLEP